VGWAHKHDLRVGSRRKLHGMQAVKADVDAQVLKGTGQR
jgi:hypothetical protein